MVKLQAPESYQEFHDNLLKWFEKHQREMPWRGTDEPYRIWVLKLCYSRLKLKSCCILSEIYCRVSDVRKLAEAPLQNVLKVWEGLGYYARARNLHRAAQIIVNEYGGQIPEDYVTFVNYRVSVTILLLQSKVYL